MRPGFTFLFAIFLILFAACERNEYNHLPESCRSSLKTDDTIIFIDNYFVHDTFFVFSKNSGVRKELLGGTDKEPFAYDDVELLYLIQQGDAVKSAHCQYLKNETRYAYWSDFLCDETILFAVEANANTTSPTPYCYWYNSPTLIPDSIISFYSVLGREYENVFLYTDLSLSHDPEIRRIYYTYKNGVIQIDFADGNQYKLFRK